MTETSDATKGTGPLPAGHPPVTAGKIGVLLVNLGTPDGTDFWPMWRYLREFLSDPRVIELPRAIWYPILYGMVLTTRPQKVRRELRQDLEPGAGRIAAADVYARPGREACGGLRRPAAGRRRMGHALRQSVDRKRGRAG